MAPRSGSGRREIGPKRFFWRQRRKELGFTAALLGEALGVTGGAITHFENGFSAPRSEPEEAVAHEGEFFLEGEDAEAPPLEWRLDRVLAWDGDGIADGASREVVYLPAVVGEDGEPFYFGDQTGRPIYVTYRARPMLDELMSALRTGHLQGLCTVPVFRAVIADARQLDAELEGAGILNIHTDPGPEIAQAVAVNILSFVGGTIEMLTPEELAGSKQ